MIILSVPYSSKDNPGVLKIVDEVDYVEYRLDYEKHLNDIEIGFFHSKTILTIRDASEGGIHHYTRDEQLNLYKHVSQVTKALIDDEILHYTNTEPVLPAERLILSWHAMNHENAYVNLPEIISLSNRLSFKYLKIAINVDNYEQLEILHSEISRSNKPVLLAGLGKLGRLARLLYTHLGAVGTYTGMKGLETAQGQLTYDDSQVFHLNEIHSKTLIGGIIGGVHVWQSLGLNYYNHVFYERKLPAVYLPFPVEDWDDFWKWFSKALDYIRFYGFSITMPWKRQMAQQTHTEGQILNTFLPLKFAKNIKPWWFNTDQYAFTRSLAFLNVDKTAPVLIYGSGAMAELALSNLTEYTEVFIYGRNEKRLKTLSDVYNVYVIPKSTLNATQWSLLINCTSLGMNGESVLSGLGDISFQSVIDLPYSNRETELVLKCRNENIPFVSGETFWKWQAEKQEELFVQEIVMLF